MDATLKRRMWKVVTVHFALSILVGATLYGLYYNSIWSTFSDPAEGFQLKEINRAMSGFWYQLLKPAIFFFQPHFVVLGNLEDNFALQKWLLVTFKIVLMPVWSYCFGWIVINMTNQKSWFRVKLACMHKLWKVAAVHGGVSLVLIMTWPGGASWRYREPQKDEARFWEYWNVNIHVESMRLLQPQWEMLDLLNRKFLQIAMKRHISYQTALSFFHQFDKTIVYLKYALIPMSSFCFAWIYVRCVNLLNRIPILGWPVENFPSWAVNHPILGKKLFCF